MNSMHRMPRPDGGPRSKIPTLSSVIFISASSAHGEAVQYSVFVCDLTSVEVVSLKPPTGGEPEDRDTRVEADSKQAAANRYVSEDGHVRNVDQASG